MLPYMAYMDPMGYIMLHPMKIMNLGKWNNISLTWIEAIWGWFPLLTIISRVRSQWGRYNLYTQMNLITNSSGKSNSTSARWRWGCIWWSADARPFPLPPLSLEPSNANPGDSRCPSGQQPPPASNWEGAKNRLLWKECNFRYPAHVV